MAKRRKKRIHKKNPMQHRRKVANRRTVQAAQNDPLSAKEKFIFFSTLIAMVSIFILGWIYIK